MRRAPGRWRWRCTEYAGCAAFGFTETEMAAVDELWDHNKQAHPQVTKESSK
jgi:hypothetical protein